MEDLTLKIIEACPFAWQALMFIVSGLVCEFCVEWLKAVVRQRTGKPCPAWLGTVFGVTGTCAYLCMAWMAQSMYGAEGWLIPGSHVFIGVWGLLFFFYQVKAAALAKAAFKFAFPYVYDPAYTKPEKKKKESATSKVEKVILTSTMSDEELLTRIRELRG